MVVEAKIAAVIRGEEEARRALSTQVVKGARKERTSNAVAMECWVNGQKRNLPGRAGVPALHKLLREGYLGGNGGKREANSRLVWGPRYQRAPASARAVPASDCAGPAATMPAKRSPSIAART